MKRHVSCQNLIFLKEESYWRLLMEVMGNVKSRWGKFYSKSTATSRAKKGKLQKREVQQAKKTGIPIDNGKSGS